MQAEVTYNWDDLEIGRFDLNHSENFFSHKHLKHEKFSEEFKLIRAMEAARLNESFSNNVAIQCNEEENKENNKPKKVKNEIKQSPSEPRKIKKETIDPPLQAKDKVSEVKSSTPPTTSGNRRPANLLTKFKTPQGQIKSNSGAVNKVGKAISKVEPPHVYDFKDIYKKKKEEMMKKLLEEEKKNRIFHSRPVPKSVSMLREPSQKKTLAEYKLTAPKTPVVLKNSREADEKRKQRLEQYQKKNAPLKFTSREPNVLQEEPFKPKKTGQPIQPQPFNLHVERRLEERKQYDIQHKRSAEEKKKQEEEERKKREEELVKELRKLASFKARPNPFK